MKEADVPVRSITAAHPPTNGAGMQGLVRSLTEYAALRWFDPHSFDWTDPDHRWLDLPDYAAKPACEHCGQPFERRTYGHRFCRRRCQRNAADLRAMARQVTVDPAAVMQECAAAMAGLRALVGEEAA